MEPLMHPVTRSFALLLFFLTFGDTEQVFIDPSNYPIATRTLSEQYCAQGTRKESLCQSHTLSYLDSNVSDFPSFMKGVDAYIAPYLKEYKESDLKKEVLSILKELNGDLSGGWYDKMVFRLFAKTPTTYTLSFESNGYSGGAHGYHRIAYTNIGIKTQKRVTLSDLFLPNYKQRLHDIALAYYKKAHNLKPSQPLEHDGWFKNRFELAENFAITPLGLYFLYNQYEIKSYADGLTDLLLPYGALKEIIDPRGLLAFALKIPQNKTKAVYKNGQMKLSVDIKCKNNETMVTAHLTPLSYTELAWLSISLPQISSKQHLLSTGYENFDHIIPYDTRNTIYNSALNKSMHAKYMLVEADKSHAEYGKTYTMWFRFKIPRKIKILIIDIRATLKNNKLTYTLPDEYEGIKGQQGYKNYRILLPLHRKMKK